MCDQGQTRRLHQSDEAAEATKGRPGRHGHHRVCGQVRLRIFAPSRCPLTSSVVNELASTLLFRLSTHVRKIREAVPNSCFVEGPLYSLCTLSPIPRYLMPRAWESFTIFIFIEARLIQTPHHVHAQLIDKEAPSFCLS